MLHSVETSQSLFKVEVYPVSESERVLNEHGPNADSGEIWEALVPQMVDSGPYVSLIFAQY